jgi:hypothetical protein
VLLPSAALLKGLMLDVQVLEFAAEVSAPIAFSSLLARHHRSKAASS